MKRQKQTKDTERDKRYNRDTETYKRERDTETDRQQIRKQIRKKKERQRQIKDIKDSGRQKIDPEKVRQNIDTQKE